MADTQQQPENDSDLQIIKLYIKDSSFEVPLKEEAYRLNWAPELAVKVKTQSTKLEEDSIHEVELTVTIETHTDGEVAFNVEVTQAGLFSVRIEEEDGQEYVLNAVIPNVLYSHLRQVIADLVLNGGFPQLHLAPINFDLMYQENKMKAMEKASTDAPEARVIEEAAPAAAIESADDNA